MLVAYVTIEINAHYKLAFVILNDVYMFNSFVWMLYPHSASPILQNFLNRMFDFDDCLVL